MSLWGTVYRKELRETLRDRRTLAVMILLPLVLYPLMSVLAAEWFISHEASRQARRSQVIVTGEGADSKAVRAALAAPTAQLDVVVDPGHVVDRARGPAALAGADAVVVVPADADAALADDTLAISVFYDAASDTSTLAEERVAGALAALSEARLAERLAEESLPPAFVKPVSLARVSLASRSRVGRAEAAKTLPFVIVLMVLMGAFYPAIDLTAGEKERGTLEPLLATPAPRRAVLAGKLLTVATISALTGLLNLICMLGAGLWIARSAVRSAGGSMPLGDLAAAVPWGGVALGLVALGAATLLFSGLLMAVASLARSFKEAQNFLTPVYLVASLPAMISWLPGTHLGYGVALLPVANVALLLKDAVAGTLEAGPAITALVASAAWAAAALALATRVYDSERLLFAPEAAPEADGGVARRRWFAPPAPSSAPIRSDAALVPGEALALFAGCTLLMLSVGFELQQFGLAGVAASLLVCFAAPVLLVMRWRLGAAAAVGLGWRAPTPAQGLGAVLVGASGWLVLATLVLPLQEQLMPTPPALEEALKNLVAPDASLLLKIVAVAVAPAIAEELLCRGALLRALHRSLGGAGAVAISALLFAVLHMSAYRFVPTLFLGVVLGVVALRAGLAAAMVVHGLNNLAVVLVAPMAGDGDSAAPWFVAPLSVAILATGFALIIRPNRGQK